MAVFWSPEWNDYIRPHELVIGFLGVVIGLLLQWTCRLVWWMVMQVIACIRRFIKCTKNDNMTGGSNPEAGARQRRNEDGGGVGQDESEQSRRNGGEVGAGKDEHVQMKSSQGVRGEGQVHRDKFDELMEIIAEQTFYMHHEFDYTNQLLHQMAGHFQTISSIVLDEELYDHSVALNQDLF